MDSSVISDLKNQKETFWLNPDKREILPSEKINGYGFAYVKAAQNRFMRFLPYIASAFPETAAKKGVIESPFLEIPAMKARMNENGADIKGRLFLKDDAHMPIAGSVKARGGIHEVLKIAEATAHKADMLHPLDDYRIIDSEEFRNFYAHYTIQAGSTGNLGIAVGRMASKLGFRTVIHMSEDAQSWKKNLLRREGCMVIEYAGNYSLAVSEGRKKALADSDSFFIDDENSEDLFFGYASAAFRLKMQLAKKGIMIDKTHPANVFIPCGVGGAPGGICFGLKELFGSDVRVYFAEPVQAPCFTLGMASGKDNDICVQDIGLSGKTAADGLAVSRSSGFVCRMMRQVVDGAFTVKDSRLGEYQTMLGKLENTFAELSACAGFRGLTQIPDDENTVNIVWSTGGGLMEKSDLYI